MTNEITQEQLEEYCKKRDLAIVTQDLFQRMKTTWTLTKNPSQAFIEQARAYEAKNAKLANRNILLIANVQNLEAENGSLRFRYENIKKLLNRYIATGLMPGYFDIYHQLCETKFKLKAARKEAAKANKRYKQLKKEFSRYRNEHTNRDCNPTVQKEHPEKAVEFKCEECASSYKDTTSDGADIMYCCESMVDGKCECDSGCVSDVRTCPGFRPKEKPNE